MALTFIRQDEPTRAGHSTALYRCDCGHEFVAQVNNVKSGNTASCGCARGTHKMSDTPMYRAWSNMRQRVTNRKVYPTYADVKCDPCWETFEGFLANPPTVDDGHEYAPGMCLSRVKDAGDYSPENARWRTRRENSQEQIHFPMTHCHRGHEMTPENTKPCGKSVTCRLCAIERMRQYRKRKKGQ